MARGNPSHEERIRKMELDIGDMVQHQNQTGSQMCEMRNRMEGMDRKLDQLLDFMTRIQIQSSGMIEEMRGLKTSLSMCERHSSSYDPVLNHFSHPHPMHLAYTRQQEEAPISGRCQGCKLQPSSSDWIYKCDPCGYVLHVSCSQMPQVINHPTDLQHTLSLLPRPPYASGFFGCDACGRNGDGFCYHCAHCQLDIHIQCVSVPLSLANSAHRHPLALVFPPVTNISFCRCNICGDEVGRRDWRYRCNECDFDAHLYCAREEQKAEGVAQLPTMGMNDPPTKQEAVTEAAKGTGE